MSFLLTLLKKNYHIIKEKILNIIDNKNYDYLFCHWIGDAHLDHRVLSEISISAGKKELAQYFSLEVIFIFQKSNLMKIII